MIEKRRTNKPKQYFFFFVIKYETSRKQKCCYIEYLKKNVKYVL